MFMIKLPIVFLNSVVLMPLMFLCSSMAGITVSLAVIVSKEASPETLSLKNN
jgi:hypothetical protein